MGFLANLKSLADPGGLIAGTDHYVQNFGDSMNNMFLKPAASGDATAQVAPPPSLITPTPLATDSDKKLAQRKAMADQLTRRGRSSTILTDSLGANG